MKLSSQTLWLLSASERSISYARWTIASTPQAPDADIDADADADEHP